MISFAYVISLSDRLTKNTSLTAANGKPLFAKVIKLCIKLSIYTN